jgi:hypothetical protein
MLVLDISKNFRNVEVVLVVEVGIQERKCAFVVQQFTKLETGYHDVNEAKPSFPIQIHMYDRLTMELKVARTLILGYHPMSLADIGVIQANILQLWIYNATRRKQYAKMKIADRRTNERVSSPAGFLDASDPYLQK